MGVSFVDLVPTIIMWSWSLCLLLVVLPSGHGQLLPVVINTWPFVDSNEAAAQAITSGKSYLDAIEEGCSAAEQDLSISSVGYGGRTSSLGNLYLEQVQAAVLKEHDNNNIRPPARDIAPKVHRPETYYYGGFTSLSPNEVGETTLDAMIMDGETHDVGSVGCLKEVKSAISVARSVMMHTEETLLVGEDATNFAVSMGFKRESLTTNDSAKDFEDWKKNDCQPNYWQEGTVTPDPKSSCGPYTPLQELADIDISKEVRPPIDENNHDTIGMIVIDALGRIGCGTSTNGATHKIPGRVGDSPITGAGCYVEKGVGGAAATGDGDVMMRFLPTFQVVRSMAAGMSPKDAITAALEKIKSYYPNYNGALVAINISGEHAGGAVGFGFQYTVYNPSLGKPTVVNGD